jgi:hypothetical protein
VIVLFHSVVFAHAKASVNLYEPSAFSVKFATALIFTVLPGSTTKLSFFVHVNVVQSLLSNS